MMLRATRRNLRPITGLWWSSSSASSFSSSAAAPGGGDEGRKKKQRDPPQCHHHHHKGESTCLSMDIPPILRGQESDSLKFTYKKLAGDDPERLTCNECGFVVYENPKIVTGAVAIYQPSPSAEPLFLLCRRGMYVCMYVCMLVA